MTDASGELAYLLRAVGEASPHPIAGLDGAAHVLRYVNPAFCRLTARTREQLIGEEFCRAVASGIEFQEMLERVLRTGRAEIHTGQDGAFEDALCWSYALSPVLSADNRTLGLLFRVTESTAFHQDAIAMNQALLLGSLRQQELTDRADHLNAQLQAEIAVGTRRQEELVEKELQLEAALKEKDVLLGEIHHRVKNNLQIVNSLLDLQSGQIQDPSVLAMLRDSQHRIRSMALIHQTLYQSKDFAQVDFGMFLQSLVPSLVQSYLDNPERIELVIDAEYAHLPINAATPCGLLVNELISNCLKHAFPLQRRGKIEISFVRSLGGEVTLSVTDDGAGIPEGLDMMQTASLGLQLVFLLTDQLRGKMEVHRANPTAFVLRFSVKEGVPATGS